MCMIHGSESGMRHAQFPFFVRRLVVTNDCIEEVHGGAIGNRSPGKRTPEKSQHRSKETMGSLPASATRLRVFLKLDQCKPHWHTAMCTLVFTRHLVDIQ